jgi:ergothioneine biosynthesis protein EgtB
MTTARTDLIEHFLRTRRASLDLCAPLQPEDYRIQSMPDVSPPWWNLGHTSWFFAKNILAPRTGYEIDRGLDYALNSYYETHGPRLARAQRGLAPRPTTADVLAWRTTVDARMLELLEGDDDQDPTTLELLTTTGIHHEQQHQELLVTEIKHILGWNIEALRAPYRDEQPSVATTALPLEWRAFEPGLHAFGNCEGGWCWDNELPVHRGYVEAFALANRLVTNEEYLEFVEDGGYRDPLLWLANGWAAVVARGWQAPLYWERTASGDWRTWTFGGMRPLRLENPVTHVSYYEADAYANWMARSRGIAGLRLPAEREWELAARTQGFDHRTGNFLDDDTLEPRAAIANDGPLLQLAGDAWEWTSNHYEPYPGYRPFEGTLMEYNGKFMDNQRVLRGGSCATPRSHIRCSYRNFWPADTRFQFTGIRLARSL